MRYLILILCLLFCLPAAADTLDDLKAEGVVKLYLDFRAGHLQDLSGNGNNSAWASSAAAWTNDGIKLNTTTDAVVVSDAAELQGTAASYVLLGDFTRPLGKNGENDLVVKKDGGGTQVYWYMDNTGGGRFVLNTSGSTVTLSASIAGSHCLGLSYSNGSTPEGYVDGVSAGSYSASVTAAADDADLYIGNYYALGPYYLESPLSAVVAFNRVLTDTEHAQVCAALASYRFPRMPAARAEGSYSGELVSNGDFETGDPPTGWTQYGGCTLSAETGNVLDGGTQVIRITKDAAATDCAYRSAMTVGKTYRLQAWGRGDATASPAISTDIAYLWYGTTSTSWQSTDQVFVADSANIYVCAYGGNAANWSEFDNVSIREVESPAIQFLTDWGATASNVNITAGQIEGTPFWVSSGTWKVSTDTIGGRTVKVLECVAAGVVYVDAAEAEGDSAQDAYGTWEWSFYPATGTTPNMYPINDLPSSSSNNGYAVQWYSGSSFCYLGKLTAGAWTTLQTSSGTYTADTWHKVRVTRSDASLFSVYVNGSLMDTATTESTFTTSNYVIFDLDAGDKIALSDPSGDHSIWKAQGVVAP